MNGWQPLAPTKRTSGMYARASTVGPSHSLSSSGGGGGGGGGGGSGSVNGSSLATILSKPKAELTKEERRELILQGPSDPFPSVGPFPRSVAVHILSYLSLSDQRSCALSGRRLAGAVADERNWRRRLDSLDWCKVDGLAVHFSVEGDRDDREERDIGRRRKGKQKALEVPAENDQAEAEAVQVAQRGKDGGKQLSNGIRSSTADKPTVPQALLTSTGNDADGDDDFGDFAGPSSETKDTFVDFPFENNKLFQSGGSSLASGMASVAMGGGRPHNFNASGAPTFTPLSPVKLGSNASNAANSRNEYAKKSWTSTPTAVPARNGSIFSYAQEAVLPLCSSSPSFRKLRAYAKALRPFLVSLADRTSPATSSLLFTCDLGLSAQTALLSNLLRFLSTSVGGGGRRKQDRAASIDDPGEEDSTLSSRGQDAAHRLLSNLLSSFEGTLARRSDAVRAATHGADSARAIRRAEADLLTHANGIWELGNARLALALSEKDAFDAKGDFDDQYGRMKAANVFLERLDIFSSGGLKHDPLDNLVPQTGGATQLDFTAMDTFMADLIDIVKRDGEIIARVFPPEQDVLLTYADKVAHGIISKYIRTLLDHVKAISTHLYLRSCAATFAQSWKLVNVLLDVEPRDEEVVTQSRCEDVVYHLWEENVDEYLRAESDWVKEEMQAVTEKWGADVENDATARVDAAFLSSQNPAAVKRSVLTGFKDVLLIPVTVVPRTAGIVGGAVIRTAGSGLSTLNPLRWQGGGASAGKVSSNTDLNKMNGSGVNVSTSNLPRTPNEANERGYVDFSNGAIDTMDSDDDDDDDEQEGDFTNNDGAFDMNEHDEWNQEVAAWSAVASSRPVDEEKKSKRRSKMQAQATSRAITGSAIASPAQGRLAHSSSIASSRPTTANTTLSTDSPNGKSNRPPTSVTQMQLLLSLDTALQVIHVNRDCMKRIETFKEYPGANGKRVQHAIQEVSLLLFRALGEGHINPGFEKATAQIQQWKPDEHGSESVGVEGKESQRKEVEPLVHFFELVHVGDTIAQMVQVYFEQEISRHIDKNDFLNPVVKGRKRFEGNLDEAVARGLNAGVDLLLGQAEHIIGIRQDPKDYNPPSGQLTDLSPTRACKEAVDCLRVHCRMLVGSTDKNVLEVFYQEVGIRLYAIICKHLKSQVISLDGGFRVIADLNEFYTFIASLRQPSLTADFSALKMLGNLYIIDHPKELAKLARDANMFGGTLSPEDLYEFLQARSDFRSIEKAIDKEMYGFKLSEDCCIA